MTDPRDIHAPTGYHEDRHLELEDLAPEPFAQFGSWLGEAEGAGVPMPNAMALATADADGRPSVRTVLLRGVDDRGFVFYTNRESRKGRELSVNPHASISFLWKQLDRQVIATGRVEHIDDAESDAYFATRPREAQIGAWASRQSSEITGRATLDAWVCEIEERFAGREVPRPPFWGGYRVVPDTVEVWQGRLHRLHDRFGYTRDPGESSGWRISRLSP